MRDAPHPASTASPGSANPVLHRFCHSTIFRSGCSEACVEGTRYPAFQSYNKEPLSIRSNHPARDANQDHGAVRTRSDATWDREDCGLWSCHGGSLVVMFKDAKDAGVPDNIAVLDEPRSGAPTKLTKAHHGLIIPCSPKSSCFRVPV